MRRGARSAAGLFAATLVLSASLAFVPSAEAQCAMCRTALESSEEGRAMASKLNRGILLLLLAPAGIAGFVGGAMLRSRKRVAGFEPLL